MATNSDVHVLSKDQVRQKYMADTKGGPYLKATGRVLQYRADEFKASITTELLDVNDDRAIFKATIRDEDGRLISTGHAMVTKAGAAKAQSRYVEMCETQAVARALGFAGYGTDVLSDDDGGESLADSPSKITKQLPPPAKQLPASSSATKTSAEAQIAAMEEWLTSWKTEGADHEAVSGKEIGELLGVKKPSEIGIDFTDLEQVQALNERIHALRIAKRAAAKPAQNTIAAADKVPVPHANGIFN